MSAEPNSAGRLLTAGGGLWLTNMLAFALVYWELDRGGPAARAAGRVEHPDLLFGADAEPGAGPPAPRLAEHLYLAYTNAMAYSPTDVLPLTRVAELAMAVQSVVSLVVVLLVLARAVNVLTG